MVKRFHLSILMVQAVAVIHTVVTVNVMGMKHQIPVRKIVILVVEIGMAMPAACLLTLFI